MSNIKCSVSTCLYNENVSYCSLESIEVTACKPCRGCDVHNSADSMCATFKNK